MTTHSLQLNPAQLDRSQVQQLPPSLTVEADSDAQADGWSPAWSERITSALWQLGLSPAEVQSSLVRIRTAKLDEPQLEQLFTVLSREVALCHASDAFEQGMQIGVPPAPEQWPGQSPVQQHPGQLPPTTTEPPLPDSGHPSDGPPNVPPPSTKPTDPSAPTKPTDPADPPQPGGPKDPPPSQGDKSGLSPWLIGAGIVGAGLLAAGGVVAYRNGAANVKALKSTAASFSAGTMNQGGLQSIRDAQLGARFVSGIGTREYLSVALPGINRIGVGGQLT
ncbi:MAG: hypothetical protein ABI200_08015, partial [Gaiellales bacterium]